ncbi:hypothetical protein ACU686_11350 [Yinghuangia aomiensis]
MSRALRKQPGTDGWAEEGRTGEAPALVAWGVDSMPYIYCWVAEDENPDRWPVRVVDQRGPGLQVESRHGGVHGQDARRRIRRRAVRRTGPDLANSSGASSNETKHTGRAWPTSIHGSRTRPKQLLSGRRPITEERG